MIWMCFDPLLNRSLDFFERRPFENFAVGGGNEIGLKVLDTIDSNDLIEREKTFFDDAWGFALDRPKRFFNERGHQRVGGSAGMALFVEKEWIMIGWRRRSRSFALELGWQWLIHDHSNVAII